MLIVVFERNVDAYLYWNTIAYWVVLKDFLTGHRQERGVRRPRHPDRLLQRARHRGRHGGLGRSTTATVVQVAMGVIISDFFLTKLFLFLFW